MKELQSMPWVPYVLSGILGFALGAAVFMPVITPEYQRGHADGYKAGFQEASKGAEKDRQIAMWNGSLAGYAAAQRGEPLPNLVK